MGTDVDFLSEGCRHDWPEDKRGRIVDIVEVELMWLVTKERLGSRCLGSQLGWLLVSLNWGHLERSETTSLVSPHLPSRSARGEPGPWCLLGNPRLLRHTSSLAPHFETLGVLW